MLIKLSVLLENRENEVMLPISAIKFIRPDPTDEVSQTVIYTSGVYITDSVKVYEKLLCLNSIRCIQQTLDNHKALIDCDERYC